MNVHRTILALFFAAVVSASAGEPSWQRIATLPVAVVSHVSAMMPDGAVVGAGGLDGTGTTTATAWILDPSTSALRPLPSMSTPRSHSAWVVVRTSSGADLYVIGGYTGSGGSFAATSVIERFRYDSASRSGQWRTIGNLDLAVGECRAVQGPDGNIIVTGGRTQTSGAPGSGTTERRSWVINTATGSIVRSGDLISTHAAHVTLRYIDQLGSAAILAAGGEEPPPTTVTELLIGGVWDARTNPPRQWRRDGVGITDPADIARVLGGADATGTATAACEWYDPKSGWRAAPRMANERQRHSAVVTAGPRDTADYVLVTGGQGRTAPTSTTELFALPSSGDPTGTWSSLPSLQHAADANSLAMSAWNLPVATGGRSGNVENSVQMYRPLRTVGVTMPSTEVASISDSVVINIENTWVLPVTIDNIVVEGSAEFLVTFDTTRPVVGAGQRKPLRVWFRPAAEGLRRGRIVLSIGPVLDTININGIGLQSTVALTTTGVDLGDVVVSTARDTCINLVVNNGSDTLRIDSISVDDSDVTVTSPLGRPRVAPGDTLRVCLRFRPSTRRTVSTSMTFAIGGRRLPVAVIGRGVRRFAVVNSRVDCDTISARVGDTVRLVVQISNPSDRPVTITALGINSTTQGTVELSPLVTFPIVIPPNGSVPVELLQHVLREGREDIIITTTDDGDTLARGTICSVPRTTAPQLSISRLDLGTVCAGDIFTTSLRIENASSLETMTIDAVRFSVLSGVTTTTFPVTLLPRTSVTVDLTLTIPDVTPLDGRISFDGSFGSAVAIVTADVAPSVRLALEDGRYVTGLTGVLPLRATSSMSRMLSFRFQHSATLLAPRAILAGDIPIVTSSFVRESATSTVVTVELAADPDSNDVVVRVEWDVLRGDAPTTDVVIHGSPAQPCVLVDTAIVSIDPLCGGASGYVYLTSQPTMIATQTNEGIVVRLLNVSADGMLRAADVTGRTILSLQTASNVFTIPRPEHHTGPLGLTYIDAHGIVTRTIVHVVEPGQP